MLCILKSRVGEEYLGFYLISFRKYITFSGKLLLLFPPLFHTLKGGELLKIISYLSFITLFMTLTSNNNILKSSTALQVLLSSQ